MVQIFRILRKMFSRKWLFLWMLLFHSTVFLTFEEAVFLPAHSYLLFSGFLLLGDGAETVAGGSSSSSAPAFALLLFNVLPLANLELALISTWVFIHFPLKILRLQCTYATGCMWQAFSSWSLNNPWVLCPISRIEVMLVKAFTFTSGFTCYSSIGMFGLTGSLESDLPTEPEWMDCPMFSFWAWGGSHVPGRILLIFRIVSKRSYLTM